VRFPTLAALAVLVACDKTGATGTGAGAASAAVTSSATAATASATAAAAASASATATASARAPVPDAIAAQHVLVAYKGAKDAPKGVTRSKADAKKRAEEVVAKAKGGADFTALVTEYSDDPGAKDRMGSLGKFTRDKMVKPFSDAAFALQVGEVSDAVETPYGYHVIKRNQ
jgi:NIMA-interacting peptidyl-prolyl cis-trans isomerase 1